MSFQEYRETDAESAYDYDSDAGSDSGSDYESDSEGSTSDMDLDLDSPWSSSSSPEPFSSPSASSSSPSPPPQADIDDVDMDGDTDDTPPSSVGESSGQSSDVGGKLQTFRLDRRVYLSDDGTMMYTVFSDGRTILAPAHRDVDLQSPAVVDFHPRQQQVPQAQVYITSVYPHSGVQAGANATYMPYGCSALPANGPGYGADGAMPMQCGYMGHRQDDSWWEQTQPYNAYTQAQNQYMGQYQ